MCCAVLQQAEVVANELVLDTETSDLNTVNGLTECTCCVQCKHILETVLQELSPARKIIQLLQEDINSKTVNNVINTTENVTNREMNYDSRNDISNEWKLVSANKDRVNRKTPLHQSQPIHTIINRYAVLGNLQNKF